MVASTVVSVIGEIAVLVSLATIITTNHWPMLVFVCLLLNGIMANAIYYSHKVYDRPNIKLDPGMQLQIMNVISYYS